MAQDAVYRLFPDEILATPCTFFLLRLIFLAYGFRTHARHYQKLRQVTAPRFSGSGRLHFLYSPSSAVFYIAAG